MASLLLLPAMIYTLTALHRAAEMKTIGYAQEHFQGRKCWHGNSCHCILPQSALDTSVVNMYLKFGGNCCKGLRLWNIRTV